MEKLTSIEQLKPGNKFIRIAGDEITGYEFLCIHPNNDHYILALNNLTQHGDKIYIPHLLNGNIKKKVEKQSSLTENYYLCGKHK